MSPHDIDLASDLLQSYVARPSKRIARSRMVVGDGNIDDRWRCNFEGEKEPKGGRHSTRAPMRRDEATTLYPLNYLFAGLDHPRVLIAEGDEVSRLKLQYWLRMWDYETVLAKDTFQANNILEEKHPPELVIINRFLSGQDSIQLCRKLRDKSAHYYQYIVMIIDGPDKQDAITALEAGADDCLAKPIEEAELKARLSVASRILKQQDKLVHASEQIRAHAMKDALTGLWNRTAFLDLFDRELNRAVRSHSLTGLLLLDLDNFKNINDTHGHLMGDMVLKETALRLKQNVRSFDFVGRYGGEEFLIALPGCDRVHILNRAEAIRRAIGNEPVHAAGYQIPITISIGTTVAPIGETHVLNAIALADVALYKAKGTGRNRVMYFDGHGVEGMQPLESSAHALNRIRTGLPLTSHQA